MKEKTFCHFCGHPLIKRHWEGRERLFCEQCNEAIYENPVPAACAIVLNSEEQVLLVLRSVEPKKGLWCLPGGFMELGETPEQAAIRELEEETGLIGEIDKLAGADAHPNSLYGTVTLICYTIRKYSGDLIAGDDASDAAFFSADNLPEIAFKSHRMFLKDYFNL